MVQNLDESSQKIGHNNINNNIDNNIVDSIEGVATLSQTVPNPKTEPYARMKKPCTYVIHGVMIY